MFDPMPATYDTLPLDARLAGVLAGWTGPVDFLCRPGDTGPGDTLDGWECAVWHHGGVLHPDRWTYWPAAPLDRVRLPLHRPESLHRLADWLAAGEREPCERCSRAWGQCSRCRDGSETDRPPWRRPPCPMWWALPRELGGTLPALWSRQVLGWSAESVARGGRAIRGWLPAWTTDGDGTSYRLVSPYEWATRVDASGWASDMACDGRVTGPETGAEGRTCADAAALDYGLALAVGGEDEPLTLPPLAKE